MPIDFKRLQREISHHQQSHTDPPFRIITQDEDLSQFKIRFLGPLNTPYQGGFFQLDVQIKGDYPFHPPTIKFDTNIYHPNISSQTGLICLDILKNAWTPIQNLRTVVLSIISLLSSPEPTDPQDAEVAGVYLRDRKEFENTAKYWTEVYASPEDGDYLLVPEELVRQVKEYGFENLDEKKVRKSLLRHRLTLSQVVNELLE